MFWNRESKSLPIIFSKESLRIKGIWPGITPLSSIRRALRPVGTFESSPLRSGGSRFFKTTRPARDDRLLLALARPCASRGLRVRSSLRDGAIFNAVSHHFVVGYYQM